MIRVDCQFSDTHVRRQVWDKLVRLGSDERVFKVGRTVIVAV